MPKKVFQNTLINLVILILCNITVLISRTYAYETNIPVSEISLAVFNSIAPQLRAEMQEKELHLGNPIFIRIFKETKELELWILSEKRQYTLFKTYTICNFSGFFGPKLQEGDLQSPEGFYSVSIKQLNPWSRFHLSFNLGFPNEYDMVHNRNGSALMIHGKCSSAGCFAMTDKLMNEIYTIAACALESGQQSFPVHIFPFHMTWENLAAYRQSEWLLFWENLKEGYDFFLDYGVPPQVEVEKKRYVFFRTDPTNKQQEELTASGLDQLAQLEKNQDVTSADQ